MRGDRVLAETRPQSSRDDGGVASFSSRVPRSGPPSSHPAGPARAGGRADPASGGPAYRPRTDLTRPEEPRVEVTARPPTVTYRLGALGEPVFLRLAEVVAQAYADVYGDLCRWIGFPYFVRGRRKLCGPDRREVPPEGGMAENADPADAVSAIEVPPGTRHLQARRRRGWHRCANAISATGDAPGDGEQAGAQNRWPGSSLAWGTFIWSGRRHKIGVAFRAGGDHRLRAKYPFERALGLSRELGLRKRAAPAQLAQQRPRGAGRHRPGDDLSAAGRGARRRGRRRRHRAHARNNLGRLQRDRSQNAAAIDEFGEAAAIAKDRGGRSKPNRRAIWR